MEAALRLITVKPEEKMSEIASMAIDLTERVFDPAQQLESDRGRWWSDEADKASVKVIIEYLERKQWRETGTGERLTRVFKDGNIYTVGDLLRIGRRTFKKYRNIGGGTITKIDDVLYELYNIESW